MVDAYGNAAKESGAVSVTVGHSSSEGSFSTTSLTIPNGAHSSTTSFTYTTGTGGYSDTITATGSGVTHAATCAVTAS